MVNRIRNLRLTNWQWVISALIIVWMFAMISVPIQRWVAGDTSLRFGITLGAVLQASAASTLLCTGLGVRRGMIITGVVVGAAWLIEFIGSHTGFPFGNYFYTEALQPQLGDVPLLVPVAWMMMMPSAWAVSALLTRGRGRLAFIVVSILAFTAWDLFLDPQMVGWGFWVWPQPESFSYFGIPWSNYAGWLLASGLITLAALAVGLKPDAIPTVPALVIYSVTWFLQTFGLLFFWNQPGPALIGGVVMGLFMIMGWRAWLCQRQLDNSSKLASAT